MTDDGRARPLVDMNAGELEELVAGAVHRAVASATPLPAEKPWIRGREEIAAYLGRSIRWCQRNKHRIPVTPGWNARPRDLDRFIEEEL